MKYILNNVTTKFREGMKFKHLYTLTNCLGKDVLPSADIERRIRDPYLRKSRLFGKHRLKTLLSSQIEIT